MAATRGQAVANTETAKATRTNDREVTATATHTGLDDASANRRGEHGATITCPNDADRLPGGRFDDGTVAAAPHRRLNRTLVAMFRPKHGDCSDLNNPATKLASSRPRADRHRGPETTRRKPRRRDGHAIGSTS